MKKIILSVAALVAFGFASAQDTNSEGFSKGDLFVTGSFGYNTFNDKNAQEEQTRFEIAPQLGYFATEKIAIGARLGYFNATSSEMTMMIPQTQITSETSGFIVGAFGRYYFTPAAKFSLFSQLGFNYISSTSTVNLPNSGEFKNNGFEIGAGLGLNYFVSSNFSLEANIAALSFGNTSSDLPNDEGTSSFSIGSNLAAVTFGVNYKF